ncbi:YbjN domain-containing protein [Alcaligenes nematophilus]|uniref:YbjN domain-containing protein n=1 Tax=Alcaligenes nematophilus TaxID=2994643 RepID=UPI0034E07C60
MTDTTMIRSLSVERLQELLQSMGYRVTVAERDGQRQLLSAAQGIGFSVRPGNPSPTPGEFIDYTLGCVLRLESSLPAGLVDNWNVQKRFARLTQQSTFMVMEMDVIVTGGVGENYLRATAELWDRLLQELVLFLREYSSKAQSAPENEVAVREPTEQGVAQESGAASESTQEGADTASQDQKSSRASKGTGKNGKVDDGKVEEVAQ